MDTLWTVVNTQPQSTVVGKHFTVTITKLLNVISRIPIIHLLAIYLCTNSSWNVGATVCPEGRLSSLALSSVYRPIVEDGSWSTPWCRTVVCPFTTGRGVGTETCGMDNVFIPDGLLFGLETYDSLYECIYNIYNCVFGSLISDVTCNYMSADGRKGGMWWPALLGHWLSYTQCWQSLLVMYWLMFGMLFLF